MVIEYYSLNELISKDNCFIFLYKFENIPMIVNNSTFCSYISVCKIISKIKYINKLKLNNNQKKKRTDSYFLI